MALLIFSVSGHHRDFEKFTEKERGRAGKDCQPKKLNEASMDSSTLPLNTSLTVPFVNCQWAFPGCWARWASCSRAGAALVSSRRCSRGLRSCPTSRPQSPWGRLFIIVLTAAAATSHDLPCHITAGWRRGEETDKL